MTPLTALLPGMIWAGFLGLVVGNFATSPIFRLPRGEPLFLRDPFCDSCGIPLKPRDLFPVFSWLASRGACRYCRAPVPARYPILEASVCILFVLCYLALGFSEQFILTAFGMAGVLMLGFLIAGDRYFSDGIWLACLVLGMLHRTLAESTIYGFAGGAFAGLILGGIVWKLSGRNFVREVIAFPSYLKLLVLGGVWLGAPAVFVMAVAGGVGALSRNRYPALADCTLLSTLLLVVLIRM